MDWECFYTGDVFKLGEGSRLVKGFVLEMVLDWGIVLDQGGSFGVTDGGEFGMGDRFRRGKVLDWAWFYTGRWFWTWKGFAFRDAGGRRVTLPQKNRRERGRGERMQCYLHSWWSGTSFSSSSSHPCLHTEVLQTSAHNPVTHTRPP